MGELLGEKALVTSVKSLIRHTLNAAGVIEAVVSVLSLKHQIVTPTLNYDGSLLADGITIVSASLHNANIHNVISNSFGFGGQNVSIVFYLRSMIFARLYSVICRR